MNLKQFFIAVPAALLLVAAGPANAGESVKKWGHGAYATVVLDVLELDEGHSVMWWRGEGVEVDDDPSSPTHLNTGDCVLVLETMPDETYSGSGFCTFTDRDGDKYFLKHWVGSGMEESRYEYTGGTGKWTGATGGGTYVLEELTDTLSAFRYKGVIELP